MATVPSAGNPVNVGPYKRIVGFYWPESPSAALGPTRYMTTRAVIQSTVPTGSDPASQVWRDVVPWDGVRPNITSDLQDFAIRLRAWEEEPQPWRPGGTFYYAYWTVYDAGGAVIADGWKSDIGVTVTPPTLPQEYTLPAWEYYSVGGWEWPTQSVIAPNPMGLDYYTDSGVIYQKGSRFLADPAPAYYLGGTTAGPDEMSKAAKPDTSGAYDLVCQLDMRGAYASFGGQDYSAIGWKWAQDGFSLQPILYTLFKTVGGSSA